MIKKTWIILGATSIIAERFAHIAAEAGHHLRLVGRDADQLNLISQDISLRYKVRCEIMLSDMQSATESLLSLLNPADYELNLFIAHSDFTENEYLNAEAITQLIQVNILATIQLIHAYLKIQQEHHQLIFLSSVAACRGRGKNSLYGASKAAIEVYLQGMQQSISKQQHITVARLGFIDTKQTYGLPGVFYAASPQDCALACWKASNKNKGMIYYPKFWRGVMGIITRIPFIIYKKLGKRDPSHPQLNKE